MRTRIITLLAGLAAVSLGAPGCVLFEETDGSPPDPAPDAIECRGDGLYADGALAIRLDGDNGGATTLCQWWDLDFDEDGYQACCEGRCCTWGAGYGSTEGLAEAGGACTWSGMCAAGLTCFSEDGGSGICRLAAMGEWCDNDHACDEAMFCAVHLSSSGSNGQGTCMGPVAVEGHPCDGGLTVNPCAAPMACVCPGGKDCRCWDGTEGDLCHADTDCLDGMRCVHPMGPQGALGPARCTPGAVGDLCVNPLDCVLQRPCQLVEGLYTCVDTLSEGTPCDEADLLHPCTVGMVCNDARVPPTCVEPGDQGQVCTGDDECAVDLRCIPNLGICSAGAPGNPCVDHEDCGDESLCLVVGAEPHCVHHLEAASDCDGQDPYSPCLPGLVCNTGLPAPICVAPGTDGAFCDIDAHCAPGWSCHTVLYQCYDGDDGDPCSMAAHCAPGFTCIPELGHCYDGNTEDACLMDSHCAEGYHCDMDSAQCYAAAHGVPCEDQADCPGPLTCLTLGDGGVCFEFLGAGAVCGAAGPPFSACDLGLICDPSVAPPVCGAAGN